MNSWLWFCVGVLTGATILPRLYSFAQRYRRIRTSYSLRIRVDPQTGLTEVIPDFCFLHSRCVATYVDGQEITHVEVR